MIKEQRLVQTFLDLVVIDSPSGHEENIGEDLMQRLATLGGAVVRDKHGNVIACWPGGASSGTSDGLLLSAHMDTVGTETGIKPEIRDGVIYSDGTTILGGDDKSGIAVILEVIQSLHEDGVPLPPLEVVFSVGEETGLQGAQKLDKTKLRSRRAYVLDSGGPTGTIVTSAPSQNSLLITVHGKTAHAGSNPEDGINAIRVASEAIAAMPLGRIDPITTANIGVIQGGVATNIVPDEVVLRGEVRSRDMAKLDAQTTAMQDAFETAVRRHKTSVDFQSKRQYSAYHLADETPVVARAVTAAEKLGFTPHITGSGGGSDANIFNEAGIACAVLSTGMAGVHTPQEQIAIADMVDAARLLAEIVAGDSQ